MNRQQVIELTEEFYKASIVVVEQVDTSRAVIPAPRSTDQVIADEISYRVSAMTIQLRTELRAEIDKAKDELAALQVEREALAQQRDVLSRECAAVRDARQMLNAELDSARLERRAVAALYNRVCAASGLCTPSRQCLTGSPVQSLK